MAYLGNDLQVAFPVYRNIDDISGSFNSSATSFPLTVNGVAPVPAPLYSQQCLISVGGVVQRPDDSGSEGFRLSGSNIVFASAPTTGADFFGVILAGADYVDAGGNFPSGTASVPSITFNDDLDTGIFNSGANQISFATGGSERLRIDSAGQIESVSLGTAAAPAFSFTTDPNTGFYSPGADQLAISTNGTGQVFIDSSGRLLVGTTTSNGAQLEVNRPQSVATGLSAVLSSPQFSITNSSNWGFPVGAVFKTPLANGGAIVDNAAIWAEFESTNNAYLGFATRSSGTVAERVRIDSSGRLLVGTSSASGNAVIQTNTSVTSARFAGNTIYDYPIVEIKSGRAGSGFPGTFIDFKRDTEVSIGSINGSTASVSYNTTSDYRLKENVVPVADGIARLQQLKPCRFNFIIDPAVTIDGFIAHEAQAVVPECVTGEKDAVDADGNPIYQGIDQSKLVPLLTAALQEAVRRIETLEAEVAALKAQ